MGNAQPRTGWINDDSSEDELGLKEIKKESEEEEDAGLSEFVKVTAPESEDSGEKVMVVSEETESESEKKPPPPYSNDPGSSSGRKGFIAKEDEIATAQFTEDVPLHDEPESDVPAKNDHESDFQVRMPGSFDTSGPPIQGQGSRRVNPRPPLAGGWADLMKRFGLR